ILGSGREIGSSCFALGEGARIELEEVNSQHSGIGTLNDEISRALGFNSRTANKVAWLGATGGPEFLWLFCDVTSPGHGKPLTEGFMRLINLERSPNVAARSHARASEVVIQMEEAVRRRRNVSNFCVAGHLAENPLLVRDHESHFGFVRVFIPPA